MKLSDRFGHFTVSELKRAIEMRERELIKTESEIRALRKLIRQKELAVRKTA